MIASLKYFIQQLKLDLTLLLMLLILSLVGLFILYSASGLETVIKQSIRLSVGFVLMIAVAQIPPHHIKRFTPYLMLVGIVLLVLVLFFGLTIKGAQRWLDLGVFRLQPSELLKFIVPIAIAAILSESTLPPKPQKLLISVAAIAIIAILIARQPDLGTAILIACSGLFVLFFSGLSWRLIIASLAGLIAMLPVMWLFVLKDYQKQRILTFLNPESDPLNTGYHIVQSKITIGSGGFWGKGWQQGSQSQLSFLPEGETDFILAVLAEEFGLIGILLLLTLYGLIIYRCINISLLASDNFSRLLTISLTLTFFTYIFVNMGMVSGLLPVVGVPLPFVSYGGSSVITLMISFGVIFSLSQHKKYNG